VGRDPGQDPRKRHGASYVLLTLAVVAALVLVGLAGKALIGSGTPAAQTTAVPNVVDMPRDGAIAKLKEAGFSPVVSTRTDTSAKNTVFDQDPPAGERRPADSQVTIVVSSGPGKVELPDLRTFSEAAAREALRSQGLTVSDTKTVDDPDVDKGDVVRTSPAAHSTVEEGSAVVLEVSSGKVEVPDVVDKDWSQAKTLLADAGLRTETTFAPSDRSENTVLDQTHAGDKVAVGTVITLTVAQPVPPTQTPTPTPTPTPSETPTPTPTSTPSPSSTATATPSTTPSSTPTTSSPSKTTTK
jgi:eukaryotic-like serine/threonine-protein kinase